MNERSHCKRGHALTGANRGIAVKRKPSGDEAHYLYCHACKKEDKARRLAIRADAPEPIRPGDPEIWARVRTLALEGVPAAWIAEDIGWTVKRTGELVRRKGWRGASTDWSKAWAHIRPNPELAELHFQFAPKGVYLPAKERA